MCPFIGSGHDPCLLGVHTQTVGSENSHALQVKGKLAFTGVFLCQTLDQQSPDIVRFIPTATLKSEMGIFIPNVEIGAQRS